MHGYVAIAVMALTLASCEPAEETTGSIDLCAANLYSTYNPKSMDQCMAVCKRCQNGVVTTCATSCTLKGAR